MKVRISALTLDINIDDYRYTYGDLTEQEIRTMVREYLVNRIREVVGDLEVQANVDFINEFGFADPADNYLEE